jgi:hypothetical protein
MKASLITNGKVQFYVTKGKTQYYRCLDTNSLFASKPIDQSKVAFESGGEHHNPTRLERFKQLGGGRVLNFGCGNSTLEGERYDKHMEQYSTMPEGEFDIIAMIEVVEHLYAPYEEFELIYSKLKAGGKLYIETSFTEWVDKDHPYLSPKLGHQTIFSHAGLTTLLAKFGFKEGNHINGNVRIYIK